ncbi:hypothetical protein [Thermobacillus composti]|jgi:hypothetical protein|uniref:hypothetical protein n=1 Tax=Thermobacillus composti TaxID=377615 RepID=UPI0005A48D31|nr:hypothetical protein [Thermobacillus composti]
MDELLLQLLSESRRLSEMGRDAGYESFVNLVELRQQLVEAIRGRNLTDRQQAMLRELQTYESILLGHMNDLMKEAEEALRSIRTSKIQQRGYQAYSPAGSMLFDRRS